MNQKYETLRGTVTLLYNENGCRAFKVKCDLGNFKVVDYIAEPLDREIYWDNDTHNQLNSSSDEYDMASALVGGYVKGIRDKLKAADQLKWPLV